jgi:hypothetical protein
MSGSRKNFEYTANNGDVFAINMDESNGELVGNADFSPTSTAKYFLPRNIKARYASYSSTDGNTQRRITVTDPMATTDTLPSIIAFSVIGGTVDCTLTQLTGEVTRPIPRADDTGLNDGDAT